MQTVQRNFYPLKTLVTKYKYELEELLHAAYHGDLVLSMHSDGMEFAYGKYVLIDGELFPALFEKRSIRGLVDLGIRAAQELYLYGKTTSSRIFVSDSPEYTSLEHITSIPNRYKQIGVEDIYIKNTSFEKFRCGADGAIEPSHNIKEALVCWLKLELADGINKPKISKAGDDYFKCAQKEFPALKEREFRWAWKKVAGNQAKAGRPRNTN